MSVWLRGVVFVLMGVVTVESATAAVTIRTGSVSLSPGGTGTLDVEIFSDDVVNSDELQAFGIRLQLDSTVAGTIQFVNPPTNSELFDVDYVFVGNSDAMLNGPTASVSTVTNAFDTYDGADFTANSANVQLHSARTILAKLELKALPEAVFGDYPIRLIDAISTLYRETDSGPIQLSFVSHPGKVTVVPEPSLGSLFGLAFASVVGTWSFRNRRHVNRLAR